MTNLKKTIGTVLMIALIVTAIPTSASAKAKVKLNKTKITLNVGKTFNLKLKNNKKKVKWTSSNKKVATVSAKGKVTAKKKGKANIVAKASGKKYRCMVTVQKKATTPKDVVMPATNPNATQEPIKPQSPTVMPIPTSTAVVKTQKVQYYCDETVDYDSSSDSHRLFFGLQYTKDGERIAAKGKVKIKITNASGVSVYSDTLSFDESDFSFWSKSSWSDDRYLCCVSIPNRLIAVGNDPTGQIEFSIICDNNTLCEAEKINIFYLPTYYSELQSYMGIYGQVSADGNLVGLFRDGGEVENDGYKVSMTSKINSNLDTDEFNFEQYMSVGPIDQENFMHLCMKVFPNDSSAYVEFTYYPYHSTIYYMGWANIDLSTIKKDDDINFNVTLGKDTVDGFGNMLFDIGMSSWNYMIQSSNLGFDLTDMGFSSYFDE